MTVNATKREPLTGAVKIFIIAAVAALSLWGCAKKPLGQAGESERVRSLEARAAKLEADLKAMTVSRDKTRKELAYLEDDSARMKRDLAALGAIGKERDALADQLAKANADRDLFRKTLLARTNERDEARGLLARRTGDYEASKARVEKLRKALKDAVSADDQAAIPTGAPVLPSMLGR